MGDDESDTHDRLVVAIVILFVLAAAALAVMLLFSTKFSRVSSGAHSPPYSQVTRSMRR